MYTTKDFIRRAKEVHADKYDYSKVEYKGCNVPITIICPKHGEFVQRPNHHLSGRGCVLCGLDKISKCSKSNTEKFIKKAVEIHGNKYDYSKVDYKGCKEKVTIICPIHGEFQQSPNGHLSGRGCQKCGRIYRRYARCTESSGSFINHARKVHGNKYDYSKVKYKGSEIPICLICPLHGEFWIAARDHLDGRGCRKCTMLMKK